MRQSALLVVAIAAIALPARADPDVACGVEPKTRPGVIYHAIDF